MSYRSSRFYTGSWVWRRVCVSLWWKTLQVKDLFWDHNRNPEAFFLEKSMASQVLCWRTKKVTIKQTPSAPRPTVLSLSGMDHRCEGGRLSGGQMSKQGSWVEGKWCHHMMADWKGSQIPFGFLPTCGSRIPASRPEKSKSLWVWPRNLYFLQAT